MALLLLIDTAVSGGSVCLAREGAALACAEEREQRGTAAWLHPAIEGVMKEGGLPLSALDAIAVSAGPGSYTGLRVGLSAAKGLCYALNKPLILLSTLRMMAGPHLGQGMRVAPMIDARRAEVFTALYDSEGRELQPARPLVLDGAAFSAELAEGPVLFTGNGSAKWAALCTHPNARFSEAGGHALHLAPLAERAFAAQDFASLAYAEPYYGKEFHSTVSKRTVEK